MSALYDITCGCEVCDTRWETTAWGDPGPGGLLCITQPYCPECHEADDREIVSINNDAGGSHPSLSAEGRERI